MTLVQSACLPLLYLPTQLPVVLSEADEDRGPVCAVDVDMSFPLSLRHGWMDGCFLDRLCSRLMYPMLIPLRGLPMEHLSLSSSSSFFFLLS